MLLPEDLNLLHSSESVLALLQDRWQVELSRTISGGSGVGETHTRAILGDVWAFWVVNGGPRQPWLTFWEVTKGYEC